MIGPGIKRWRGFEFAALFVAAPLATAWLVHADALSPWQMPTAFLTLFGLSILLLFLTPEFSWKTLVRFGLDGRWRPALIFVCVTVGALTLLTQILAPHALFRMPLHAPELWTRIMTFYPIFSVIPQGIIYRALFFSRYRILFPSEGVAIVGGAVIFGLAHLFFLNWVAVALTVVGGGAFAWAHGDRGGFWFANLLHAFAGAMVFTVGLGRFFYHGAI